MQANRRAVTYSSVIVLMAVLLSVGLLQLTQTTAQSATLAAQIAVEPLYPVLTITKTVEGAAPSTDWQFFDRRYWDPFSDVTVLPAVGAVSTISVPSGAYSITEVTKDGYWLRLKECNFGNGLFPIFESGNVISDIYLGEFPSVACEFTNSKVGIELTKTVGIDPAECAQADELLVFAGTEVYYCYEVKNTGVVTFPMHWLDDDPIGNILDEFPYNLGSWRLC